MKRRPPLSESRRTVITGAAVNTLAVLPMYLLGALAVLMRRELGFSETQLGAAVSLSLVISAIGSVSGGRLVQRVGHPAAMSAVAVLSGAAMLGIAAAASYLHLLAWMAVAGCSNALSQPATALAIARGVSPKRQGLAFGIKQAAFPAATTLGGIALPVLGLTVGWRWAFGAAGLAAVVFLVVVPRQKLDRAALRTRPASTTSGMIGLMFLTVALGFGSASASALTVFYVESAVHHGIHEGAAGIWFAAGSIFSIGARMLWGWRADHREGGHLTVVALLMGAGAVGFALLALPDRNLLLAIGTILAFSAGWAWMGLFQLAVVRANPHSPASAMGITSTGGLVGAAIGPVSFGALVQYASYPVAWWAAAGALLAGSALMHFGRRVLQSDEPIRVGAVRASRS